MKKFLSIKYSASAFNLAMFLLRLGVGALLLYHGYDKLVHFANYQKHFVSFLGMPASVSLSLSIFAEFFCSIFVALGLFTRLAVIPIVIQMLVALGKAHHFDIFNTGEKATLFLVGAIVILLCGPGRISVDGVINK